MAESGGSCSVSHEEQDAQHGHRCHLERDLYCFYQRLQDVEHFG